MASRLVELVERWCDLAGIEAAARPDPVALALSFPSDTVACRPGVERGALVSWERRHGYRLPDGLKGWLALSNGLFATGPLVHPLSAVGPMVPFARVPGLLVQPESWFELGNPNVETVCLDLGYRWPEGGGCPVFRSGDDDRRSPPRLIAPGFDSWFLAVLNHGGREFWFDADFADLGDPWAAHRLFAPVPSLAERLRPFAARVAPMIREGVDDRVIAARVGLSRFDIEAILRHVQHLRPALAPARGDRAD